MIETLNLQLQFYLKKKLQYNEQNLEVVKAKKILLYNQMSRHETLKCQICKTVKWMTHPSSYVVAQYKYWLPLTQTRRIKVAKVLKTSNQHKMSIYDRKEAF